MQEIGVKKGIKAKGEEECTKLEIKKKMVCKSGGGLEERESKEWASGLEKAVKVVRV